MVQGSPNLQSDLGELPVVHVVDDDQGIRLGLDSLFRSVGYDVHLYANTIDFLRSGKANDAGCPGKPSDRVKAMSNWLLPLL